MKFDLGGVQDHDGYITVNLTGNARIKENILNLDAFCKDNTVEEFYMSHTYEHISPINSKKFIKNILKKLKNGGKLHIIQTDAKKVLDLYKKEILDFKAVRDIIFTPISRRIKAYKNSNEDLMGHKYMWGEEELMEELLFYGFSKVKKINGGTWKFDIENYFPNDNMQKFYNINIPNLRIVGIK